GVGGGGDDEVVAVSLEGADVRGGAERSGGAALVGGREAAGRSGVEGGAADQQRHRLREAAVVGQGAQQRGLACNVVRGRAGDRDAARVFDEVVIVRDDRAGEVGAGRGGVVGDNAVGQVERGAGIGPDPAAGGGCVARDGAVDGGEGGGEIGV